MQGSYLCPFWSKFKKLHEVWKVFFKGNNLRPSATPYFNLFRSYSSTKAIIKSCPIWHLKKQICLKSSNIPFSTSQVRNAQYSHSRIFYLDFSWHTGLSIENRWGPKTKCLKSNIPLSSFYLDFSRHTSLLTESHWRP